MLLIESYSNKLNS